MTINYLLESDMALLRAKGTLLNYTVNQAILSEHSSTKAIFWVVSGSVRIELSRLYRGSVLANIGPGQMFGEISFLGDGHASATVVANGPVEVLRVDGDTMEALLAENGDLAGRFFRSVASILALRLRVQSHKGE